MAYGAWAHLGSAERGAAGGEEAARRQAPPVPPRGSVPAAGTAPPMSRAVWAVPLPVGPTFTALASASPLASTTSVRPAVAGAQKIFP